MNNKGKKERIFIIIAIILLAIWLVLLVNFPIGTIIWTIAIMLMVKPQKKKNTKVIKIGPVPWI